MEECFPNEIVQSCGEGDETEVTRMSWNWITLKKWRLI